jgi:hypothetical protein
VGWGYVVGYQGCHSPRQDYKILDPVRCKTKDCSNIGHLHYTYNGKKYRSNLCDKHHKEKYDMKQRNRGNSRDRLKKKLFGVPCQKCGWSHAPCDIHRIIPGFKGGRYTTDNVIVLCPNCHRLAHLESH